MRKAIWQYWTVLAACALAITLSQVATSANASSAKITLVLTSDVYKMGDENGRGGMARIAAVLKAEKAAHANVLTVHAGDTISPSLMSGFDQGAHIVDLFNMAPLDVFVPGNHEFDFGPEVFLKRMGEFKARVLAANLREAGGKAIAGIANSHLFTFGAVKIGVIGLTEDGSKISSRPGRLMVSASLRATELEAASLRKAGADLIVLVAHAGRDRDEELFASGLAEVILSGHDHDLYMRFNEKTAIVEAGEDGMAVAVIDLDVSIEDKSDGKRRVRWWPHFRFVDTADAKPDAAVGARVAMYDAKLNADLGDPVGKTASELDSRNAAVRGGEAVIGNLFADALREGTKSDAALLNGGGFRGGKIYPAGSTLSRKDVLTELPFLNKAYVLQVSGATLRSALEQGFVGAENEVGRFPQVSGLRIRADVTRPEGRRVVSVLINGAKLKPKSLYRLVTNDYLANGGDGYSALKSAKILIGDTDADLVSTIIISYLRSKRTVTPKFEGRIVVARARAPH